MFSARLLSLLSLVAATFAETVIVSGATWTDTSGNPIQAHGAGILKVRAGFVVLIDAAQQHPSGWKHLLLGR